MLINNNKVYAGYSSKLRTFEAGDTLRFWEWSSRYVCQVDTAWCRIGRDGEFIGASTNAYVEDIKGRKLVYFTTTPVDPEGSASVYVNGKFYIKNAQVFASIPNGTDLTPWLQKRYNASGDIDLLNF